MQQYKSKTTKEIASKFCSTLYAKFSEEGNNNFVEFTKKFNNFDIETLKQKFNPYQKYLSGYITATLENKTSPIIIQDSQPLQHEDEVELAAISPDGKRIVTTSGNTAYVWDTNTNEQIMTLEGHKRRLKSAVFSHDGTRIATASEEECSARIWDATTGQPIKQPLPTRSWRISFNHDGTRILTANQKHFQIWDTETQQLITTIELSVNKDCHVWDAAFSPDTKRALTITKKYAHLKPLEILKMKTTIHIWDTVTQQQIGIPLTGYAAFSPDGTRIIVTASNDKTYIYDASTGERLVTLPIYAEKATFSPDGKLVETRSVEEIPTVLIWDASTGKHLVTLSGHTHEVISVAFSLDGTRVITASADNTARIWDISFLKSNPWRILQETMHLCANLKNSGTTNTTTAVASSSSSASIASSTGSTTSSAS